MCALLTYSMAAPYNPNQQPYPPQGEQAYPLQREYSYPPQKDHVATTQYPPPVVNAYPSQGYPPEDQTDLPPAYPTNKQEPPPAYYSEADQLAYDFQPQPAANATAVDVHMVAAQPRGLPAAIGGPVSSRQQNLNHPSELAICAFAFSLCTLIVCGGSLICLCLSIPALILSVMALKTRGNSQEKKAGFSICLNVAAVVCSVVLTVVLLVAVVTPVAVTANTRSCSPYYSSSYNTYCVPHSYSTLDRCRYYQSSYSGYCPLTFFFRYHCPNFYKSGLECNAYSHDRRSCMYISFSSSKCASLYRPCPAFYSYQYSTYCEANTYSTRGDTPCSFHASHSTGGYCPT